MEKKEVNSATRIEDHMSGANNVPDKHSIVQADVTRAILAQKAMHHREHMGMPHDWEASMANCETIHRARHHEPGEPGASTWKPRSNRPGSLVRE